MAIEIVLVGKIRICYKEKTYESNKNLNGKCYFIIRFAIRKLR